MRIKRIEILGFKSFVDKVTLEFDAGVSGIVGPNGCGKSNIVDAIRWAMGEQSAKNLRGRAMEDIIFGGSEARKPLGMAEVTLTFANDDGLGPPALRGFAEIAVTRRLYRDGESEYQINKTACRLLDISELFMDTGVGARAYSIIEQGKIGMILNAKPEDRRFLIEEAAGVTKFKSRKKTALRKIEATRQNLLRLSDIVSEVRRQLAGLKRQAQKAQRFRELREELKVLEVAVARRRYGRLAAELAAATTAEEQRTLLLEGVVAEAAAAELRLEEARLRQGVAERDAAQGQERLYHYAAELQKIEDRIALSRREEEGAIRQRERLLVEVAELTTRLAECDREEEGAQGAGLALGEELQEAQRRLAEGQSMLEELGGTEQETNSRLEGARSRLFALLTELSRLGNLHEEAQRRLRAHEDRVGRNRQEAVAVREQSEEVEGRLAVLCDELGGLKERRLTLHREREETLALRERLKADLDENEQRLLVGREELNRCRSRLESLCELERNLEGYGNGVRTILRDGQLGPRFVGMVADLLDVPPACEIPVEAALGERLQTLVAPGADAVGAALDHLRRQGGRSGFLLPWSHLPAKDPFAGGTALLDLIGVRAGGEAVARLLDGVCLVDSLAPYLNGGLPNGVVLVTADGETLTWQGEYNGGSGAGLASGLLHKKNEIKELTRDSACREAVVEELQQRRQQLREALRQAEEQLTELGSALHRKDLRVVEGEKDQARLRQEVERLAERVEVLSLEEEQLHDERLALEGQLDETRSGRTARDAEKLLQEELVARLQEELLLHRRDVETVRERVTALRVEVASLREREEGGRRHLERLFRLRQELHGRKVLLEGRLGETNIDEERLHGERQRLQMELEVLAKHRDEEKGRVDRLREGFEARCREVTALEEELKVRRQRLLAQREELGGLQLKMRELQLEVEHLCQTVEERYRLDLAATPAEIEGAEIDDTAAGARCAVLRRAIDEIGEVNLMAVEEYQQLDERYQFLVGQQEDLRQSLDGLQAAIGKINRTTRKRFRETFDLVNAKFQEIFPRLFRGGRAELRLTDEEDLLETGIDIIVQPPGKKLQNVSLLSGGEKALTAVALIFSIFLVKPSPFCLLDEVDAPLDDANIGRFNEMVREMSAISQFVIITHNKRTMEIADTLYGVTMEEPGVSKLVSVHLGGSREDVCR